LLNGLACVVIDGSGLIKFETHMLFAITDEVSVITTGNSKISFRTPYAMTFTKLPRANVTIASTSGIVTIDIKKNGTTILGANKLTIDANEKSSVTAALSTSLSTTSCAEDDEITFDVVAAGTGTKGLKVCLYYKLT
jgi:hypothetical protein